MGTKVLVGIVNQGWIFDFDGTIALGAWRVLFHVHEGWLWGTASPPLQSRGRIPGTRKPVVSASHHGCEEHSLPQDDKVNCTGGRQSAVIEILAEQNLVCVIIVCQALAEAKIHSTWCIHCFQPNTHQGPYLQALLLYNNSSLRKQLNTAAGNSATVTWMSLNVMLWTHVKEIVGSLSVKLPTQFSGFGCFYSIFYCRFMIQINN